MKKFLLGLVTLMSLNTAYAQEQGSTKFDVCSCVADQVQGGTILRGYNIVKFANGQTSLQTVDLGQFAIPGLIVRGASCRESLVDFQNAGACPRAQ